jgi:hypothetical protein
MSVPVRAVARLLALFAVACAGSAAAQAAPEGRAWTDPPVRGSALAAETDTPKVADTAPAAAPARPEPRAVDLKPRVAVAEPRGTASKRRVAAPKPRIAAVRPRPVAVARVHPVRARTRDPRPMRYGVMAPPPTMVYVDSRAGRIRQAEAAGYLVVRRTTFAAPDGRFLYGYRPYEADDE